MPQQKGNATSKESLWALRELVYEQPGIPVIAAAWALRGHYKNLDSARQAIRAACKPGKPWGIEVMRGGEGCAQLVPVNGKFIYR